MIRATLAMLVYNQLELLEEATQACFNQCCEPIEILISDDCSKDGSYERLLELASKYKGPHHVRVRQNETNLGIGEHVNRVVIESQGELIVCAAGDDISHPNRVARLLSTWDSSHQKLDLIASHVIDMDFDGQQLGEIRVADLALWDSPAKWTRKRPYVIGASHAFTKRMHLFFGPFNSDLVEEDQVLALRATCMGGGQTVDAALVCYRRGGISRKNQNHDHSDEAVRQLIQKKFSRQAALYSQIQKDLERSGHSALWRGKVRRNLIRAELVLRLLKVRSKSTIFKMALQHQGAGFFWAMKYAAYLVWPWMKK